MKPFPFQKDCVRAAEQFGGRTLFSCDMGLGKSAISLWFAKNNNTLPMVIICPASIKWQWQAEIKKVVNWNSYVCEGMKPKPLDSYVVVINYTILGGWLDQLRKMKPRLIVVDECQHTMSPKTAKTKNVAKLCRGVPNVLALSGTPLVNRPIELFPMLHILRPDVFKSRFTFGINYCAGRKGHWGWEFKGATKTKELNKLLTDTCMVRKRKSEELKDLPAKIHQVVPVDLQNRNVYEAAEDDFIRWLHEQDPKAAIRAMRAEAVTKAGYLLRLAAKGKLKSTVDWINEWLANTDGKLIVFAVHRKMIEALQRRIDANSVIIDGTVAGIHRQDSVDRFQNDPGIRVLIGNVQAAGVGLNLTAASSVVFTELPWQPGVVLQAIDRAHRIGQTDCVNVYYLVARNTLEEKRCNIISRKQEVLTAVLDGEGIDNDLDVFDEFLNSV